MSNAYINQILFGNSKDLVDEAYIRGLEEFMMTDERARELISNTKSEVIQLPQQNPVITSLPTQPQVFLQEKKTRYQPVKNSLFWSIYEIENPEEAFLGTRANAEVENRLKVVAELKKTPKRLKETNSKLTIEQMQALLGSMLVAKEDKLEFCIAYAAYYNKPIVVVYEKTYRVFSPLVDADLAEEDVIVLYASKHDFSNQVIYRAEKTATKELISKVTKTRVLGPLRSMSSYKNPELDELAGFFQIPVTFLENRGITGTKEKRRKKEEVYNDIKLAIHNDMNFIATPGV
jgi:hypothetical protein